MRGSVDKESRARTPLERLTPQFIFQLYEPPLYIILHRIDRSHRSQKITEASLLRVNCVDLSALISTNLSSDNTAWKVS